VNRAHRSTSPVKALQRSLDSATEPVLRERLAAAIERLQRGLANNPPATPQN
jgi:hypothetical protein